MPELSDICPICRNFRIHLELLPLLPQLVTLLSWDNLREAPGKRRNLVSTHHVARSRAEKAGSLENLVLQWQTGLGLLGSLKPEVAAGLQERALVVCVAKHSFHIALGFSSDEHLAQLKIVLFSKQVGRGHEMA